MIADSRCHTCDVLRWRLLLARRFKLGDVYIRGIRRTARMRILNTAVLRCTCERRNVCYDLSLSLSHIGKSSSTDSLLLVYCRHGQPSKTDPPSLLRGYPADQGALQQMQLSSPDTRMMSSACCCWSAVICCRANTDETYTSRCAS